MGTFANIILCTCDQLRPFEVGCYGNGLIRTPNLDRLAREGTRFEVAITSYPVCMAARSSMLSGQFARRCTGGVGNAACMGPLGPELPEYPVPGRLHLKESTLPEVLRNAGYYNALIGKWHVHVWPHELGFDYCLMCRVYHRHTGQSYTENGGPEFVPPGYSVDFEAGRVERFLHERSSSSQPFFLFYNISPPHCPLADAPERYLRLYDPEDIPVRPNVDLSRPLPEQDKWLKVYLWDHQYYRFHLPYTEHLPAGFGLRQLIAMYYGLTTWVDDAVGRMLSALDSSGLAESTIVVFTSDHGDYLGSHGRVQKGGLHEESIRIPLLFRWPTLPGSRARVVSGQVASLVDLAPTILDLIGLPVPPHMHGQSLAPMLRGDQGRLDRNCAFVETAYEGVGIRTPRYLYALPWAEQERGLGEKALYFFDLGRDPYQLRNLASVAGQHPAARELDQRLRHWHNTTPWMS